MDQITETIRKNTGFWLIAALTLGLAPFSPEPHLFGKIRWILGGGKGMTGTDWFDLLLHGLPFVLLFFSLILRLKNLRGEPKPNKS